MTLSPIKMTARQFLQLGEDPPGIKLELVKGAVVVSPSPRPRHAFVVGRLLQILWNHVEAGDIGELFNDVDTIFGEHDVRRPDVLYFTKARLHLIGETAMQGPPDLSVEVLSPGNANYDRKEKFKLYEESGVAHYWIVDPDARTIEGYKLSGKKYRASGHGKNNDVVNLPPFETLSLKLSDLWRPRS